MLTSLQRWLIFPRWHNNTPDPQAAERSGAERLWLRIPQGKVEAWFLRGEGCSPARPGPLLIYAHGNAELIDHWPEALAPYRALGINLLLPEYRGYGRSAGSPSQQGIVGDTAMLLEQALRRPEVDGSRVVLQGRSLGGGVVCDLALRRPPAALILQSTFTSLRAMARRYLVPGFLVRDPFDNLAALKRLEVPLLVVHGTRDRLVPYSHARALHAAVPHARLVAFETDHNDALTDDPRFWREVASFLRDARILPRSAASSADENG